MNTIISVFHPGFFYADGALAIFVCYVGQNHASDFYTN